MRPRRRRPTALAVVASSRGGPSSLTPALDIDTSSSMATSMRTKCWRSAASSGILDWETARVDHPFWDFDLGEWGTGLWRQHRHDFSRLWSIAWQSYARERGLDMRAAPLEAAFRLRQALYVPESDRDPSIVGTVDEHLGAI